MENTDPASEGDPLKRGEDGVETGTAAAATELKGKSCKEVLGLSKLTHWRTAVFFFSLFLCLTIVFAFSFIIPCPVRPQYLIAWNRSFPGAETYDFLAIEDASKDMVKDIMIVLKDSEGSQNNSCGGEGLPSPCLFVVAVDGTDGKTLWERPLKAEFHWAQCGLDEGTDGDSLCLLRHCDQLTAVNKHNGVVRWQKLHPAGLNSTDPVLVVPDLDRDGVRDLALVASNSSETLLIFLSGKTGDLMKPPVVLDSTATTKHLFFHTGTGCHYVLLQNGSGLFAVSLWRIAAAAGFQQESGLKKDKNWERNGSAATGLVPVFLSESLKQVLKVEKTDDVSNLLLLTDDKVALVDGQKLQLLWSVNTSSVLSEPTFGHFNKDGLLDVVVEEEVQDGRKRVTVLDGKSGVLLWDVELLARPNSPRPASFLTTNTVSVFMFWGLMPPRNSSAASLTSDRRSYLLHPLYSKFLLESTNVMDHIVTFKATLMERGRHAAYILLTGPSMPGAGGTVVLSKRKLKQDVPSSSVQNVDRSQNQNQNQNQNDDDVKEAFNRLRFSNY